MSTCIVLVEVSYLFIVRVKVGRFNLTHGLNTGLVKPQFWDNAKGGEGLNPGQTNFQE